MSSGERREGRELGHVKWLILGLDAVYLVSQNKHLASDCRANRERGVDPRPLRFRDGRSKR